MSFLLSCCPSFRLPGHFLGIVTLVFSKFWHNAKNPYQNVRGRVGFSRKIFLSHKLGKWTKNEPKWGFFEFIGICGLWILLNLIYNENFILFSVFLHKSHVWENFCSWNMGQNVPNQLGFFNQPHLQNKSMK